MLAKSNHCCWFCHVQAYLAVNVYFVGLNLAVFRDDNGNAYILDAYCPHLGANIAIGGHVIGDCLECPFHGWQFRGSDGKVMKIPYSESSRYRLTQSR